MEMSETEWLSTGGGDDDDGRIEGLGLDRATQMSPLDPLQTDLDWLG